MRSYRQPRITPDDQIPSCFGTFTGLVNTRSRKSLGLKSLYAADNILLSSDGRASRRPGAALFYTGSVRGGFTHGRNVYLDDAGTLVRRVSATDVRTILAGLTGTSYTVTDVAGSGYFTNGEESGIVRDDAYYPLRIEAPVLGSVYVLDSGTLISGANRIGAKYVTASWRFCATYETADGREGPASEIFAVASSPSARLFRVSCPVGYARTNIYATEANGTLFRRVAVVTVEQCTVAPTLAGRSLMTLDLHPIPQRVDSLCVYLGKLYAAEYLPADDATCIWFSSAYALHLFGLGDDYVMLPGRVTFMAAINDGFDMAVATTKVIGVVRGTEFHIAADYGSVPSARLCGSGEVSGEGVGYTWTERGFCTVSPFKNLTEKDVSMAPGTRVTFKLAYIGGEEQLIAVTQGGGTPFNQREERA